MILINLLPHRELARKRARDVYSVSIGLAAAVGVLIAGIIYSGFEERIANQQSRNAFLTAQNVQLDNQIKEVASLQQDIAALKVRQQAVESLQVNRNLPVYLFSEAASMLPSGTYLNSIKQDGRDILFTGVAQSQERVSELLRNLSSDKIQWLTRPELVEVQASQLALSARDQRRVYNFTVRAKLTRSDLAAGNQKGT